MDGSESTDANIMIPLATMLVILSICFLLIQKQRKRCRDHRRHAVRSQVSLEEASISTSWSTRVVCNGIHGDANHEVSTQSTSSVGEQTHLLGNNIGTLYT